MAFQFAYSLDGNGALPIVDYPKDTVGNYGTGGAKKGDLVILSSGLLRRGGSAAGSVGAIGVLEGGEFLGLANGGTYAATTGSFTDYASTTANGVGKVRIDKGAVYRVRTSAALTDANVGNSYGILTDGTTGDQTVNIANTTNLVVKIIGIGEDADKKTAYVVIL